MKVTGAPHRGGSIAQRGLDGGCRSVAVSKSTGGRLAGTWWYYCDLCPDFGSAASGFSSWRAAMDASEGHLARHLRQARGTS